MSEEKKQVYTVKLSHTFPGAGRWRAGRQFARGEAQVLKLTKDEVRAFKDDTHFELQKGEKKGVSAGADEAAHSVNAPVAKVETVKDSTVVKEEKSASKVEESEVDTLVKTYSRDELDAMAIQEELDPEEYTNKRTVAEAIVEAKESKR